MRKIHCAECKKYLFSTDESDGSAGSKAQRLGFIFKMPFLYTTKYSCLFFCCKECQKKFYDKNIPKDPEVDKKLEEFRKKIPEMSKDLSERVNAIVKLFKQFKNTRR